tara:strand:+ start:27 stop:539 length:513 start_codon:yes stop_codon:yes gene_type:complete
MADREYSWQKANPAGDPAEIARVQADIDARNPTKPGQYTGKPVPLGQKERRPPTVNANRIEAIKDQLTSSDPEDLMLQIMQALNNTVEAIPTVGNYYTFVYNAKTAGKQYDQHPLIACTDLFRWGFRGINFHWQSSRNYTWEELTGQVYMVKSIELDDLLSIPYAKFITK